MWAVEMTYVASVLAIIATGPLWWGPPPVTPPLAALPPVTPPLAAPPPVTPPLAAPPPVTPPLAAPALWCAAFSTVLLKVGRWQVKPVQPVLKARQT